MNPKILRKANLKFVFLMVLALFLFSSTSQAQLLDNNIDYELLAKALPDEDFFGIGNPNNNYNPYLTSFSGTPKVNQAYVWGLTRVGNQLWFGTAPNVHCLVVGGYLGLDLAHETDCWTCEFGETQYSNPFLDAMSVSIPGIIGDWRPSRIFMYDLDSKTLTEKTPTPLQSPLLNATLGLRSAGSHNGVVFLGGPALNGEGIILFAYNAQNGNFIGAMPIQTLADGYVPGNIRKWLVMNNELYLGVGVGELLSQSVEGRILKWTGDVTNPFQFEIVGNIKGDAAELVEHEGRIFVNTWGGPTGIWMSPVVPAVGGLTNSDKDGWERVWGIEEYEVDLVTMNATGGGALASFGGYLFWGTMHVPMMSAGLHMQYFPPEGPLDVAGSVLGTYRAISIFRGKNFGETNQEVDLLYGQKLLPAYDPSNGWTIKQNNMPNSTPLFGLSGFGNFMNNYTWTMQVYNDKLYVGTMDWSFLVAGGLASILDVDLSSDFIMNLDDALPTNFFNNPQDLSNFPYFANLDIDLSQVDLSLVDQYKQVMLNPSPELIPPLNFGADLWVFDYPNQPARPLSVDGVGNKTSYGIRTMVASETDLFLGMANPMNLCEKGGWELIKLTDVDAIPTKNDGLTNVEDELSPDKFYVVNNYPNPFNPSTTIKFNLPEATEVQIEIYNSIGQIVEVLTKGHLESGIHQFNWNADNMTSGVYFYKIKAGSNLEIRKMTLMK
ncbi:MAG: T9SS type A sorting domain-containing protein [Ignavibacteriales bacterium]|nr:T9SS type A sorting domain-containing protein [Ignavibacteriales bacterium]